MQSFLQLVLHLWSTPNPIEANPTTNPTIIKQINLLSMASSGHAMRKDKKKKKKKTLSLWIEETVELSIDISIFSSLYCRCVERIRKRKKKKKGSWLFSKIQKAKWLYENQSLQTGNNKSVLLRQVKIFNVFIIGAAYFYYYFTIIFFLKKTQNTSQIKKHVVLLKHKKKEKHNIENHTQDIHLIFLT